MQEDGDTEWEERVGRVNHSMKSRDRRYECEGSKGYQGSYFRQQDSDFKDLNVPVNSNLQLTKIGGSN